MDYKGDNRPVSDGERKSGQKFVVVGCGMVGVVLAIELKRRFPECSVTLLEKLTEAEATNGSWVIGLAAPGLKALSNNPVLLEKIKKSGQLSNNIKTSFYMNKRLVRTNTSDHQSENKELNYMLGIDRGATLKVCLSHLKEEYPDVNILFGHRLVQIDESYNILVTKPPLPALKFDILFGADGANSKVRRCCDSISRESHVTPCPQDLLVSRIISTPSEIPGLSHKNGLQFYLSTKPPPGFEAKIKSEYSPMAKGLSNMAMTGTCCYRTDEGKEMMVTDVLMCRDHIKLSRSLFPETQEELDENLKQLGLPKPICENLELGEDSHGRTLLTVKATQYHNDAGNVVILGDAAHATFPSLSGGFQTGLQDVYVLLDCLCKCKTKEEALVEFSKQRVAIGRALVDVSNIIAYSPASVISSAGKSSLMKYFCRFICHGLTCGLVKSPNPMLSSTSDAYRDYLEGKKTTVELADEWEREIVTMNQELEGWKQESKEEHDTWLKGRSVYLYSPVSTRQMKKSGRFSKTSESHV